MVLGTKLAEAEMAKLLLAADIAEIVCKAANEPGPLDTDATAGWLYDAHIQASALQEDIAENCWEEDAVTGSSRPIPYES